MPDDIPIKKQPLVAFLLGWGIHPGETVILKLVSLGGCRPISDSQLSVADVRFGQGACASPLVTFRLDALAVRLVLFVVSKGADRFGDGARNVFAALGKGGFEVIRSVHVEGDEIAILLRAI